MSTPGNMQNECNQAMNEAPRKKQTSMVRKSPLYQVFEELQKESKESKENAEWINQITWTSINKPQSKPKKFPRKAFLIHINEAPPQPLYPEWLETHFSIDNFYKKTSLFCRHGYTPIHLTELYKVNDQSIVVHAYLDRNGQYVYSQTKTKEGAVLLDLKIDEEQLQINLNEALKTLRPLIQEQRVRYLNSKQAVDALEEDLRQLTRNLSFDLAAYERKAEQLLEKIRQLDRYSESSDPRENIISANLNAIEQQRIRLSKVGLLDQEREDSVASPDSLGGMDREAERIAELEESKETGEHKQVYESLATDLNKLMAILFPTMIHDSKKIKDIQEKHNAYQEANQKLIMLLSFPKKEVGEEGQILIKKVLDCLEVYERAGVELLSQVALAGQVDGVEALFPLFEVHLKDEFYIRFINRLVQKNPSQKKELVEIANFFNLHSTRYRSTIFTLSLEARYVISKREVLELFKVGENLGEEDNYSSLLFKVYCNRDLETFELLLKHGANPKTWGIIVGLAPERATLFGDISGLQCTSEYWHYLKLLLFYGADPNAFLTPQEASHTLKEQAMVIRKLRRKVGVQYQKAKTLAFHAHSLMATPFAASIINRDVKWFRLLLPQISLDGIAHALAHVSRSDFVIGIGGKCEGNFCIEFLENKNELLINKKHKESYFIRYYFCKKHELIYQMLKETYQVFRKKMEKIDLSDFQKIYQKLFFRGQTNFEFEKDNPGDISAGAEMIRWQAYYCFYGCGFLLFEYSNRFVAEKEKRDFLCTCYNELLGKILPAIERLGIQDTERVKHLKGPYETIGKILKKDQEVLNDFPWLSSKTISFLQSEAREDLTSPLVDLLVSPQEFNITTRDSENPILGAMSVLASYAIIMFHPSRTCLIHWNDNVSHDQLELAVNKFLNGTEHTFFQDALEPLGFSGQFTSLRRLIKDYLGGPALSVEDCTVVIMGGWSDHEASRKSGNFVRTYFQQKGFKNINLNKFQIYKEKQSRQEIRKGNAAGFYYIIVDARNGQIKFSIKSSIVGKQLHKQPLVISLAQQERKMRADLADSNHLQDDRHPGSGTKLVFVGEEYVSTCEWQLKTLINLALQADLKGLKEFLEQAIVNLNTLLLPTDPKKRTILHFVCSATPPSQKKQPRLDCVELLITHGANPSLTDSDGRTAFRLIEDNFGKEAVERLELYWRIREFNLKRRSQEQAPKVLRTFALFKRRPQQLLEASKDDFIKMQIIKELLQTAEGRRDLRRQLSTA